MASVQSGRLKTWGARTAIVAFLLAAGRFSGELLTFAKSTTIGDKRILQEHQLVQTAFDRMSKSMSDVEVDVAAVNYWRGGLTQLRADLQTIEVNHFQAREFMQRGDVKNAEALAQKVITGLKSIEEQFTNLQNGADPTFKMPESAYTAILSAFAHLREDIQVELAQFLASKRRIGT